MSEQLTAEPFPGESLSSYLRRMARRQFFTDPISFLRAGGVEWHDRSRDPDLLTGVVLHQVAVFFGLELERVAMLTIHAHLRHLAEQDRRSIRWWARSTRRTRMCDQCVAEQPYGRLHWRFPLVTECLLHRRPLLDECRLCGAIRYRASRRWERFDCRHHIHQSAGADSLPVDLRVQQAIQASLGIRRAQPQANAWLIHAALGQRRRLVEVQSARQSLRQLWVEQRRVRARWHRPAQALRTLMERGERMYPTLREGPVAAAAPPELVTPSLDELRDIVARLGRRLRERSVSAPDSPVAVATSLPLGQPVAF